MIPSILLPLAEWPLAESARDHAFWLARRGDGHIHALAVVDVKAFEIPVLGTADGFMPSVVSPPVAESQGLLEELTRLAKERLGEFADSCMRQGISCSTETKTGIPGDIIARQAVAHDIVVMSRTGYSRMAGQDDKGIDALVSQVIRGSIRPVLVAVKEFPDQGEIRRVAAAFDGSTHAGRAMTVAAELASAAGVECFLLTVAASEEAGEETLLPAEAFLYHHGVTPKKRIILSARPSEVICDFVGDNNIDILIMGAYGHGPIREKIFGSMTQRVLMQCGATVILQS